MDKAITLAKSGLKAVKAVEAFTSAIESEPQNPEGYNNRGNAYVWLSQYERAIENYDEAIRLCPQDFETYGSRALAYTVLGDDSKAEEDIDKAIDLGAEATDLRRRFEQIKRER